MASPTIPTREPEIFAAGDTLTFERYLPDFSPTDGWHLHYALTDPNGALVFALDSVASTTKVDTHFVNSANFAAGLEPGDYAFTGQAVNTSGEKHQISYTTLTLKDDLSDGRGTGAVQTEAQEMIALIKDTLRQLYKSQFSETEDLRSRFRLQDQSKALEDLKYWKEVRLMEIQQERVRNGRSPGNTTIPVFWVG